jgi:hypothetical protein
MPQIQVTNETMNRMKKILGKNKMRDGDYFVNENQSFKIDNFAISSIVLLSMIQVFRGHI